ncbi:hypothetical protein J2T13_003702 [Paenibacillus sp. DS2015]
MSYIESTFNTISHRMHRISDPSHVLCRDDIIWVLHYVQQKVAQEDPAMLDLSKPRLLHIFQYYGEVTLLLLSRSWPNHLDQDTMRSCLMEVMHGLVPSSTHSEPHI